MPSIKTAIAALLHSLMATATPILSSRQDFPFLNDTTSNDGEPCTWTEPKLAIPDVMSNFVALWQGNQSEWVVDHTVLPSVSLWTDHRLLITEPNTPTHTVPVDVTNSTSLLEWMNLVKSESQYVYNFYVVDPSGNRLVARWALEEVLKVDTPVKKAGDIVTMNGTDIIEFDSCSGRISKIMTSHDILVFAYQMGIEIIMEES